MSYLLDRDGCVAIYRTSWFDGSVLDKAHVALDDLSDDAFAKVEEVIKCLGKPREDPSINAQTIASEGSFSYQVSIGTHLTGACFFVFEGQAFDSTTPAGIEELWQILNASPSLPIYSKEHAESNKRLHF